MERRPENSSAKIAEKSMSCLTTKLLYRVHYLISSDSDTDYNDFDNFADLWRNGFDRSDVCSRKTLESWLDYMQSNGGIDNWKNTHPCFLLNNLTLAAYLMKRQFTNLSRKLFNDGRFSTADVEQILDDLHITDDSSKKYSNAILSISRKPITEEIVNNIFEPYKIRFMREGENNSNVIEPAEPSLGDIKDKLKKILDEAESSDDEEESFVSDEESEFYKKVLESEEYEKVQKVVLKFSKEKPDNESDLRKSLLNIIATSTRLLALLAENQESTSSGTKTTARKRLKSYENEKSSACENEVIVKKKKGHSMPKEYSINELLPRVIIKRIDARKISQEKSRDFSLHDNAKNTENNKRSDTESSQDLQFLQECSTLILEKNEDTHNTELSNVIEIEFECKNVKPTETSFVSENLNISIDCEPNNQNEKIPQLQSVQKSQKSVKSKTTSKSTKSTLRTIRNWTNRKRHKCDTCKKKFKSKFTLDNHINTMHKGITLPCDLCGKTFTREDYLNNHIDSVHKGITHPCDLCDKILELKNTLKYHKDFVHNVQKSQNCNTQEKTLAQKCPKSFNYKNNLSSHINTVHESKNYPCNFCKKIYATSSSLKVHKDSMHKGITYPCDPCKKVFRSKHRLKEHNDFMHNGIAHRCDLCEKSFSGQYKLKRHINGVHYGIKQ